MDVPDAYKRLSIAPKPVTAPRRRIVVGSAAIIFVVFWMVVPHDVLFWLLLALVTGLIWVASYGWRGALSVLHEVIHWLEEQ
jgi:hypothetical protein